MWYINDCANQFEKHFILILQKLQIYSNYEEKRGLFKLFKF